MRYLFLLAVACTGCMIPGSLKKLEQSGVPYPQRHTTLILPGSNPKNNFAFQYLGCGGLHFMKDDASLLIDPFFSNPGSFRITRSVFTDRRSIRSKRRMVKVGWEAIRTASGKDNPDVKAVFSAHSHYDHLMDVPALMLKIGSGPDVFLSESGFNNCFYVIDTSRMVMLEKHMTTPEVTRKPIEFALKDNKRIQVYPILSDHNPHFKNIKFFDGALTRPVYYYKTAYAKTRANDWLEGRTFSFLIDYIDANGEIELRLFIQASSCNPPHGIPPKLLLNKPVDIAFLGIASYPYAPDYPCVLLEAIKPREVVWIHWEDFFRRYTKSPKTLRGTNIGKFFDSECLETTRATAYLFWPRVKVNVEY